MPATTTQTNDDPERGLPDRNWDHSFSHLKVDDRQSYGRISTRCAATYRKGASGWERLLPVELPERLNLLQSFTDRSEFLAFLTDLNTACKRLYQKDKQQKAERQAKWTRRQQRIQAAQEEYRQWLHSLDFGGADAYKEDPGRWVYRGGEDGGRYGMSFTRWLHRKAHKHYADEAKNVAAEIRERYGLYRKTHLV